MKRQPNSILKSPNNPSKTTISIPSSLQGLNTVRRVSFGRELVHEFSVESTYSENNTNVTQQPSSVSMEVSMELTCMDKVNEVQKFLGKDQHIPNPYQPISTSRVLCGREPPTLQSTGVPLMEKHCHNNVQLPSKQVGEKFDKTNVSILQEVKSSNNLPTAQNVDLGHKMNFGREQFRELSVENTFYYQENNCAAVTPIIDATDQQSTAGISMGESIEQTCIGNTSEVYLVEPSMDILQEETMQPAHLSPHYKFHASSRMSYQNYCENSLIDKVDESVQTTFNESPICLSKCKPTLLNISIPLPTRDKLNERRYKQYLEYRESIKRLRLIVAKKRTRILELQAKKEDLEKRYEEEEIVVNNLRENLVTAKARLRGKRDAIQLDVMSRLHILQEKFIHVSNDYSKIQQELNK